MKQATVDLSRFLPIDRETAAKIATTASHYECTFTMEHGNSVLNLKSMLGLLSQIMPKDGIVTLKADGADEEAALADLLKVVR